MTAPAKKQRGRPALLPDEAQTEMIRERVTKAQRSEYEARGGKVWLAAALTRKHDSPGRLKVIVELLIGDDVISKDEGFVEVPS